MTASADFRPRMEAQTRGLRTLAPLAYRRVQGAVADVWSVQGDKGGGGFYTAPDPRIVIFLDDTPPPLALRSGVGKSERSGVQAFYIPADAPLWSRLQHQTHMTHLDFHLDQSSLHRRLASGGVRADLTQIRMFPESRELLSLGRLAADEVRNPRRGQMLLDGLLTAALGEIFAVNEPQPAQASGGLAPWQMAAVERLVRDNMSRHVGVAELSDAARLSESWFSHCFRQQTGHTPQRWQAQLRLDVAEEMMADQRLSLAEIAHATGFSDQAHLSRTFRMHHGQPPSIWRRNRFPHG
ncbi:MAG: AraC family transcriptional regulator [Pseudotabrizicola sp.]|uniref:helix-turn-helix domain-containing protein n=1 Tax=Pseudotabrizicola sp. TaxID=2939647 RepID=UPI002718C41B|nr:AraC family transcriptional regulator [Pseudotabrizicola sp.]MDO9638340.1 AraC family transcriptional regulator [Pseudotabrizicola sp.]